MASNVNASKELHSLVEAMVKQAYAENIKVTELNQLISKYRKEMESCKPGQKVKNQYREATEEENKYREEVYDFFSKEISLEEVTPKEQIERGYKICESIYKERLLMFSEIMCAAKMLANDGEKITNYKIRDILWLNPKYTNYSGLLGMVGLRVKSMKETALRKFGNNTWEYFPVGYKHNSTAQLMGSYFQLLEKNGIQ